MSEFLADAVLVSANLIVDGLADGHERVAPAFVIQIREDRRAIRQVADRVEGQETELLGAQAALDQEENGEADTRIGDPVDSGRILDLLHDLLV